MATTDSAERLLLAIREYRKHVRHSETNSIATVWAKVFHIEANDTVEIYMGLAELLALAKDVENTVKNIEGINHAKYLSSFPKMRAGLTPRSLNESKKDDTFDGEIEARLEHCSDLMVKETVLESQTLDQLSDTVNKLFDDIKDADIQPGLRKVLLDLVEKVRRAISEYHIRGLKGLKEAIGTLMIDVQIHRPEIEAAKPGAWKQTLGATWKFLQDAVQLAVNMKTLLGFTSEDGLPTVPWTPSLPPKIDPSLFTTPSTGLVISHESDKPKK